MSTGVEPARRFVPFDVAAFKADVARRAEEAEATDPNAGFAGELQGRAPLAHQVLAQLELHVQFGKSTRVEGRCLEMARQELDRDGGDLSEKFEQEVARLSVGLWPAGEEPPGFVVDLDTMMLVDADLRLRERAVEAGFRDGLVSAETRNGVMDAAFAEHQRIWARGERATAERLRAAERLLLAVRRAGCRARWTLRSWAHRCAPRGRRPRSASARRSRARSPGPRRTDGPEPGLARGRRPR